MLANLGHGNNMIIFNKSNTYSLRLNCANRIMHLLRVYGFFYFLNAVSLYITLKRCHGPRLKLVQIVTETCASLSASLRALISSLLHIAPPAAIERALSPNSGVGT